MAAHRAPWPLLLLPLLLLPLLLLHGTAAFNIDLVHPVIFRGPVADSGGRRTRADTYFGYSVGLSGAGSGRLASVLVGAPRANSTLAARPTVLEQGALFRCPLRSGAHCREVLVDDPGSGSSRFYTDLRDRGWLGGALDVESGGRGRTAVSAFRWRNRKYTGHYLGNGACYVADAGARDDAFVKYVPLYEASKQSFRLPGSVNVYYYSYGQAGMAVHFPDNGRELVLGAPGVFDWTGTLLRFSDIDDSDSDGGANRRRRRRRDSLELGDIVIPNPYRTEVLHRYDYLGYSVGSGRFYSSDSNTFYLAGAPRAAHGKGKAYLLDFPRNEYEPYDVLAEWEGATVGEYFGSAVLAVDLTGDGLSEVVVGAPLFGDADAPERGRVAVYMNADRGLFSSMARVLVGSSAARARFGSALARVGDLDLDGFEDLAVGAPYEDDGRGAIYIYRGGPGDLATTASQRIAGRDVGDALRGFGASISRGLDVDANRYPDLVVGAYTSGDAVLLRSRPVIEFVTTLTASPDKLQPSARQFEVEACMAYRGSFVPAEVNVNVTVGLESFHAESALVVNGQHVHSHSFPLRVARGRRRCTKFTVAIRASGRINFIKPIQLSMRYELISEAGQQPGSRAVIVNTGTDKRNLRSTRRKRQIDFTGNPEQLDDFCSSCPVPNINKDNQQLLILNVPFSVGCDDVCSTDLKLSYSFPDQSGSTYVIGSTKTLTLNLSLKNGGQAALLPTLTVDIPTPLSLVRVPPTCQERNRDHGSIALTCSVVPHPFFNTSEFQMRLLFDMADVTSNVRSIKFNVSAISTGVETNPRDNVANITLALVSEADMEILGSPYLEQVFYDTEDDRPEGDRGQPNYVSVKHTYQILKYLYTPVKAVAISFLIPVNFTRAGGQVNFLRLYPPAASISGQPLTCSVRNTDYIRSGQLTGNTDYIRSGQLTGDADYIRSGQLTGNTDYIRSGQLTGNTDYIRSGQLTGNTDYIRSGQLTGDADAGLDAPLDAADANQLRESPLQHGSNRRRRRQAEPTQPPIANGTLVLNCTAGSAVTCVRMTCQMVSFLTAAARASVTLDMRVDVQALGPLLAGRDRAAVFTHGFVHILDGAGIAPAVNRRPDMAVVGTALLPSKLQSEPIAVWIIIVSVLAALALLAGIIYLLYRAGFFRRSKHEQLLEEKQDAEVEENFGEAAETEPLRTSDN